MKFVTAIAILAIMLCVSCVKSAEVKSDQTITGMAQTELSTLSAEITSAKEAVQATDVFKEYLEAQKAYTSAANAEFKKMPVFREWQSTRKGYLIKISKTPESQHLQKLLNRQEALKSLMEKQE